MPSPLDADWHLVDQKDKHIISVGWNTGQVKVCLLQFHKSGIFVHFPYHPDMPGLLTRGLVPAGAQVQVNMKDAGAVTSHKVKYTHHVDGNARFSQGGKIRTVVRGKAADLRTSAGHIFSIDIQGLSKFASFETHEYYGDTFGRGYFEFQAPEPEAVHIVGRWFLLREGLRIDHKRNPLHLPDSGVEGIAMAPPAGSNLEPGFVVIDVSSRERMTDDPFLLLFTGSFEEGLDDPAVESAFLGMKYPAGSPEGVPSIDL